MAGFFTARANQQLVGRDARSVSQSSIGESLSLLGRTGAAIVQQTQEVKRYETEVEAAAAEREKARAHDAKALDVSVAHVQTSERLRVWRAEHENDADFETAYTAKVKADVGALRGMLGQDQALIDRFDVPLTQLEENEIADAAVRAGQIRAKAQSEQTNALMQGWKNVVRTSPARAGEATVAIETALGGLSSIPDALKPAMINKAKGELQQEALEGAIEAGGYDAVGKALRAGTYDGVLPEGGKEGLLRKVDAEERAAAAVQAHAVEGQRKLLKEQMAAAKVVIDSGGDVPTTQLDALSRQLSALGETADAAELAVMSQGVATNRAWRGKSEAERRAALEGMNRLDREGKLRPDQQIQRNQLQKLHDSLTKREVQPLKDEFDQGAPGRASVAAQLQTLPYQTRMERAEAIKPGFSAVVALPPETRDMAIRGVEDIERVKDHFTGQNAKTSFSTALGAAVRGDAMNGEMAAAKAIYAFRAREQGVDKWDEQLFGEAVTQATGGVKKGNVWRGGLQPYAQGSNTRKVILPSGYSVTNFNDVLRTEATFKSAELANGRAITKADVLRYYTPVLVGKDEQWSHYKWYDDQGGILGTKGSDEDYILRLRNR